MSDSIIGDIKYVTSTSTTKLDKNLINSKEALEKRKQAQLDQLTISKDKSPTSSNDFISSISNDTLSTTPSNTSSTINTPDLKNPSSSNTQSLSKTESNTATNNVYIKSILKTSRGNKPNDNGNQANSGSVSGNGNGNGNGSGSKVNNKDNNMKRVDSKGVQIVKGSKKHKIVFKENLNEVQLVENWKKYNMENYNEGSCHCIVF